MCATKKEHDHEKNSEAYVFHIPNGTWRQHFSSLLFSADITATLMEILLLGSLTFAAVFLPVLNVQGSMPLLEVAILMCSLSLLRRLYMSYLEAVYCSFPQYRTQPVKEHELKELKDIVGREKTQLLTIIQHDRLTLVSQFVLDVVIYFSIPGYYPSAKLSYAPCYQRMFMLVLNHYVMSFGMYWMHRALHKIPWLWKNIHSFHHWAKHPLSRTTYQDHWLDNFGNAIVGHLFAQILVPLDHDLFWFSRMFRVCESLEKHSGISCWFNVVHMSQRWLPYAQMPHHHDWHHEGHKGCNYTFTSIGGLWDCIFATRKTGRHPVVAETRRDKAAVAATVSKTGLAMDNPVYCLAPVVGLALLAAMKLSLSS